MSQYLLLKDISVQNANAIAGLTYGFPAMTNFLGFTHTLSRKLPTELGITLGGVAVISHQNIVHARQPKGWGDYVFALTRNPLTQKGTTAPINEEGRMNMTLSLLIEISGLLGGAQHMEKALKKEVEKWLPRLRIAGGQIINIGSVSITNKDEDGKVLRRLMPGFILVDRSNYLKEHFEQKKQDKDDASLFDAWCDFSKLKYKATKVDDVKEEEPQEKTDKAIWEYVEKPNPGYLVPIVAGYCAITPVYEAGEVEKVRDTSVPVAFAEAAYSVAEWMSMHRLESIEQGIWRYAHSYPWYLAKAMPFKDEVIEFDELDEDAEMKF
ncbi:type I-F CRISPR-associated protein Csy2 [Photobacterium indicum]|uniref:type I-F CRISPR-associated protein Csy2 n=1 Tax=Photobacterium indicum TaxID=81447 RepID=UPI003D1285E9